MQACGPYCNAGVLKLRESVHQLSGQGANRAARQRHRLPQGGRPHCGIDLQRGQPAKPDGQKKNHLAQPTDDGMAPTILLYKIKKRDSGVKGMRTSLEHRLRDRSARPPPTADYKSMRDGEEVCGWARGNERCRLVGSVQGPMAAASWPAAVDGPEGCVIRQQMCPQGTLELDRNHPNSLPGLDLRTQLQTN